MAATAKNSESRGGDSLWAKIKARVAAKVQADEDDPYSTGKALRKGVDAIDSVSAAAGRAAFDRAEAGDLGEAGSAAWKQLKAGIDSGKVLDSTPGFGDIQARHEKKIGIAREYADDPAGKAIKGAILDFAAGAVGPLDAAAALGSGARLAVREARALHRATSLLDIPGERGAIGDLKRIYKTPEELEAALAEAGADSGPLKERIPAGRHARDAELERTGPKLKLDRGPPDKERAAWGAAELRAEAELLRKRAVERFGEAPALPPKLEVGKGVDDVKSAVKRIKEEADLGAYIDNLNEKLAPLLGKQTVDLPKRDVAGMRRTPAGYDEGRTNTGPAVPVEGDSSRLHQVGTDILAERAKRGSGRPLDPVEPVSGRGPGVGTKPKGPGILEDEQYIQDALESIPGEKPGRAADSSGGEAAHVEAAPGQAHHGAQESAETVSILEHPDVLSEMHGFLEFKPGVKPEDVAAGNFKDGDVRLKGASDEPMFDAKGRRRDLNEAEQKFYDFLRDKLGVAHPGVVERAIEQGRMRPADAPSKNGVKVVPAESRSRLRKPKAERAEPRPVEPFDPGAPKPRTFLRKEDIPTPRAKKMERIGGVGEGMAEEAPVEGQAFQFDSKGRAYKLAWDPKTGEALGYYGENKPNGGRGKFINDRVYDDPKTGRPWQTIQHKAEKLGSDEARAGRTVGEAEYRTLLEPGESTPATLTRKGKELPPVESLLEGADREDMVPFASARHGYKPGEFNEHVGRPGAPRRGVLDDEPKGHARAERAVTSHFMGESGNAPDYVPLNDPRRKDIEGILEARGQDPSFAYSANLTEDLAARYLERGERARVRQSGYTGPNLRIEAREAGSRDSLLEPGAASGGGVPEAAPAARAAPAPAAPAAGAKPGKPVSMAQRVTLRGKGMPDAMIDTLKDSREAGAIISKQEGGGTQSDWKRFFMDGGSPQDIHKLGSLEELKAFKPKNASSIEDVVNRAASSKVSLLEEHPPHEMAGLLDDYGKSGDELMREYDTLLNKAEPDWFAGGEAELAQREADILRELEAHGRGDEARAFKRHVDGKVESVRAELNPEGVVDVRASSPQAKIGNPVSMAQRVMLRGKGMPDAMIDTLKDSLEAGAIISKQEGGGTQSDWKRFFMDGGSPQDIHKLGSLEELKAFKPKNASSIEDVVNRAASSKDAPIEARAIAKERGPIDSADLDRLVEERIAAIEAEKKAAANAKRRAKRAATKKPED